MEPGKVWEGKQRKPWETAAGREEEEEEEGAVANPEKRPKTRRQEYRQARSSFSSSCIKIHNKS